jgi:hypothetical protein
MLEIKIHLKILPLKSQHIFSLLLFVAKNRYLYESNSGQPISPIIKGEEILDHYTLCNNP